MPQRATSDHSLAEAARGQLEKDEGPRSPDTLADEGPISSQPDVERLRFSKIAVEEQVLRFAAEWQRGSRPNAVEWLARCPELRHNKSALFDMAYEEYCQRREAGESVDIDQF